MHTFSCRSITAALAVLSLASLAYAQSDAIPRLPNGKPVDEPELDVTLTLPAKSLGPLPVKLSKLDIGHWAASALQLPMAGSWQLSVSVRSDAIDETTVTATMNVSA